MKIMLEINFHPFKTLYTERLILRRLTENDLETIFKLRSNPELMKYIPRPLVKTLEEAKTHYETIEDKIENNVGINWGIALKDEPEKAFGIIGHYRISQENYRSEIGYMILDEYSGKGFVTEAIDVILDYGFNDLKLHSIEAIIDPDNIASEKVLIKSGFVKEAHILENEYFEGKFWDTVIYSILQRNYKKK